MVARESRSTGKVLTPMKQTPLGGLRREIKTISSDWRIHPTMKVVTHTPEPVQPPPTTYDLLGLSELELEVIGALLGRASAFNLDNIAYRMYVSLPLPAREHPSITTGNDTICLTRRPPCPTPPDPVLDHP